MQDGKDIEVLELKCVHHVLWGKWQQICSHPFLKCETFLSLCLFSSVLNEYCFLFDFLFFFFLPSSFHNDFCLLERWKETVLDFW